MDFLLVTDPEAPVNWAKCAYAQEPIYCVAVACPKLSILASYLRIFVKRPHRVASYLIGAVIAAAATAGVIASLAACRPFSARWDPARVESSCINFIHYWQGTSVVNIATDLAMLILPIPVVWQLQMPKSQKAALMAVFMLGSLCEVLCLHL